MKPFWSGVFPAITTQLHKDGSLDLEGTAAHVDVLIRSGVSGLVFLGSLGENQSMTAVEKREVMEAMLGVVGGRVKVLSGVAEAVNAFVGKSLESGRVPSPEEMVKKGGCGEGCGCH